MNKITSTQKKWALLATIMASGMAFVNGTMVNVTLPAIQSALGASVQDMQWVISIYTFFLGTLVLIGGSAGDYFGRKRIFGLGIWVFLAATIWCGLAANVDQLIAARAGQALGATLLVPGSLAIITDLYETGGPRGKAIGTWSAATALATAFGPLIGGLIVDHLTWRYIFLISIPLAIIVLVIVYWKMPESKAANHADAPDWKGAVLAAIGLGLICYGLIESSKDGITQPTVLITLLVGMGVVAVFLWLESRAENPMVPLSLFYSRNFSGATLLTSCMFFSLSGVAFLLPFNLIQVQGYSATAAGAALLPFPALVGGLSRWSGGLIKKTGVRPLLTAGPVLTGLGLLLLAILGNGHSYWTSFFPGIFVAGLGIAISYAPVNTTIMSSVEKSKTGTASGVNESTSRLSGMLSVALLGALAISFFGTGLDRQIQSDDVSPQIKRQVVQQKDKLVKIDLPETASQEVTQTLRQDIHQAFLQSFKIVMLIAAAISLATAIAVWFIIEPGIKEFSEVERNE